MQSLQHFSTDLIVEGTSRFIKVIRHDIDLPYKLPPGMSARFRIGTSLAEAVKVRPFLFLWVVIEKFLKEKQSVFTFIMPYI